jgi:hypothetical protein
LELRGRGTPEFTGVDIAIDPDRRRVFAATHGRGVFMLADQPELYTFEGWTDSGIWDMR